MVWDGSPNVSSLHHHTGPRETAAEAAHDHTLTSLQEAIFLHLGNRQRDARRAGVGKAVKVLIELLRRHAETADARVDDALVRLMADHPVHILQRLAALFQQFIDRRRDRGNCKA